MQTDLIVIIVGSLFIAALLGLAIHFFYMIVSYLGQKKMFEKKFAILLSKSNQMKLSGSEKAIFKIEGANMDEIQRAFAKFNYSLLLHIRKLLYFVELNEKFTIREFVIYSFGAPIVLTVFLIIYFPNLAIFSVFAIILPYLYLLYLRDKKIKTFVSHFPAVLEAMASNLRAGADLIRAIQSVATDEENFFSKDFKLILAEVELGVPVNEAFENYANKIGILEVDLFAMGITMSMKTGANLADFFTKISEMIRQRIELKGKINVVTSESRFSMMVMCLAPFGIAVMQTMMDKARYIGFLQSPLGQLLIYTSIVFITIAIIWVSRIMKIEEV